VGNAAAPVMRRSSLATSAMLHAAVLILVTISFPFLKKHYDEPSPMQVELVDIAEMAQTTKAAAKPEKTEKKPVEEKKPEVKKPQPAPTNKSVEPKPVVLKPDKVEEKVDEKPEEKVIDENAVPKKKPEKKPDKKPEEKPVEKRDFSSVLKNLVETKPQLTPAPNLPREKTEERPDGQPLPLGQRMTMQETDALRRQLEGCWNVPIGARDADTMTVDIYMVVNQDRTLQSARIVDSSRYDSDTFFRAMADSALRAVYNPNCSPFELPPDKYETWKTITVTFDPSQMF
jgi:outer membrane biosynthesis protein TonB